MSFYKRRRPKPEEEKCADPAKARARALDALASREMSSAQLYERLCYGLRSRLRLQPWQKWWSGIT